jgi:hypothetical protein
MLALENDDVAVAVGGGGDIGCPVMVRAGHVISTLRRRNYQLSTRCNRASFKSTIRGFGTVTITITGSGSGCVARL